MTHSGKFINERHLAKVSGYLAQWLDDEEIIALFRTSRMKPHIDGLVLTSGRILTISGMNFGGIQVVDEIAADDVSSFAFEKGFGKSTKFFVEKKDGEKVYLGGVDAGTPEQLNNCSSSMHGAPQPIADRLSLAEQAESDAKKQAAAKKSQEDAANRVHEEEKREAVKAAKQERKAAEAARIEARGKKLGYVFIKYIGGYNPQDKKTFFEGLLNCYENEVEYKDRGIAIAADQIVSFEIAGKEQTSTTSRLTVTRMVTLGIFSLAAPKHKTKTQKEATIYIGLRDGRQVMFQTKSLTESDVHRKLANAISHYSSLQTEQNNRHQAALIQTLDVAGEITRFADLKKQGILTDDEFEAKKRQLLNL